MSSTNTNLKGEGIHKTPAEICKDRGWQKGTPILWPNPSARPITIKLVDDRAVATRTEGGCLFVWDVDQSEDFAMFTKYKPPPKPVGTTTAKPMNPVEACKSVGAGVGDRIRFTYVDFRCYILLITAIGESRILVKDVRDDGSLGSEYTLKEISTGAKVEKVEPPSAMPKVTIDTLGYGGSYRVLLNGNVCAWANCVDKPTPLLSMDSPRCIRAAMASAGKAAIERELDIASPAGPETETDDPWRGVAEFTKISGRLTVAITILNDLIANGRIWVGKPRYDALMAFLNFKVNTPEEYDAFRLRVAASETNPPDIQPGPAVMKQVPERLPSAWGHK